MGLRIKLSAPFAKHEGYGNDGLGIVKALLNRGIEVYLDPTYVIPPISREVAMLLTQEPNPPYDVHIKHVNPIASRLTDLEKSQSYRHILWSMWENSSFSDIRNPSEVAECLSDYDKILAYDETSVEAFNSLGTETPVSILQGGYDPEPWTGNDRRPLVRRDWNAEEFVFVMAGSITPRKDPYVALRALSKLYNEGYKIKFYLKTLKPGSLPPLLQEAYPFLEILEGAWTESQMRDLYERAHCYLGPSWGEGKNLPAIEAGTTGTALILSDVGGHRVWTHPAFATLVGGEYASVEGETSLRVDADALAEACRDLIDNRDKAAAMGEQASRILPVSMNWDRVIDRLLVDHIVGR